ncbi:helix-turn-helix domain-containing protein [Thalassobacillus sp. C254]|uniref:helix-turn-helix domain-containing protein n=1 Tax=Thalassobacillus sp. C254 TaxID=1225341 RepID=UPI0006D096C3|nr:helix-turn-helix domain-containing protein [Thalassobacillus sp. C254]
MSKTKSIDDYPLVLRAEDVAEITRVSKRHAYEIMTHSGLLIPMDSKSKRVPRDAFFQWLQQGANQVI